MYVGDDCPTQPRLPRDEELAHRLTRKLKQDRATRMRKLAKIKRAVADSEYENALKLSVALDRLLDGLK